MAKQTLTERFQQLAGIKPLSEENFDNINPRSRYFLSLFIICGNEWQGRIVYSN